MKALPFPYPNISTFLNLGISGNITDLAFQIPQIGLVVKVVVHQEKLCDQILSRVYMLQALKLWSMEKKSKPVPMSLCDVSWNMHWKLPRSVPILQLMFIFVVSHWCTYVEFDDRHAVGNHSQSVLLLVMSIMILQNGKINFQQAPYSLTSSQVNDTP